MKKKIEWGFIAYITMYIIIGIAAVFAFKNVLAAEYVHQPDTRPVVFELSLKIEGHEIDLNKCPNITVRKKQSCQPCPPGYSCSKKAGFTAGEDRRKNLPLCEKKK